MPDDQTDGGGRSDGRRSAAIDLLLVEDSPTDARLTLRALAPHVPAERVHVARDGAETLDHLLGGDGGAGRVGAALPKLVLLDLKLPKVSGLEVLQRLRADERTRAVPVVVFSSSDQERDVADAYRLGANGYVVKPMDVAAYTQALRAIGDYWLGINQPPVGG